ncbi:ewing's tumor-associated antigen 1 homolog isoform X2 [Sphaeramia orbicularis]|uniref:ewing's tumor-associated antigen 1 homolog isoform X2 n=1 Tax=Sphaeramia orbicularis TaxID=375764 RepID=UPI001180AB0A|nr:ewing's tumor-associated antigen 1 isoform X2 [Sphaeramia orbicularis]
MSERRTQSVAAPEFTEYWRNASRLSNSKTKEKKKTKHIGTTSPLSTDLQSPKRSSCSRFLRLNNADSPGDVEPSQDIIWDSTSPTPATTGNRCTRVVEISEIVNRLAPKDERPMRTESPLLQWIGDSAIPCTPEFPKLRVRKRSTRQNSVEDLMKLARQFDENMQQDKEASEQLNTAGSNPNDCVNSFETVLTDKSLLKNVKEPCSIESEEAELRALFDCSTQRVSGRLSQGSSVSTRSEDIKEQSVRSTTTHAAENESSGLGRNKCDDLDNDWGNDDLLNDSLLIAISQNLEEQHNTETTLQSNTTSNTTQCASARKPSGNANPAPKVSNVHLNPSCSAFKELCPKPKTTNRSTFKLGPNPHLQPPSGAAKEVSKSNFTVIQSSNLTNSDQKSAAVKTPLYKDSAPQPDKISNDRACGAAEFVKDISDSLWDDGDDALLYQVCDSVERISNSQPQQTSPNSCQEKQDITVDRQRKTTAPLPIKPAWSTNASTSANRQSPRAFVRCNSLPGTSCESVNYQGWNIPMKGSSNKSGTSQSLPGSHVALGSFSQFGDSSGTFQPPNANLVMQPHIVTVRPPQISKSHSTAFKRTVSDAAVIRNKVFVTSQMPGKCSAAEIERKKQEALARRRQRMQNPQKP